MRKIKWWKRLAAAMMTAALLLPETTIYTQARTGQHVQTAVEQADNRAREADLTISSARELKEFAQKVNRGNTYQGKLIKLACDIQFDGVTVNNFEPIGNWDEPFNGIFDGCGYTVSGVDVTKTEYQNEQSCLFGYIGEAGIVRNVTIKDSQVQADYSSNAGGIAGCNQGTIDNCHNRNANIQGNIGRIGGIAGENYGVIVNCSSTGSLESVDNGARVGGIAGENYREIYNCCNLGSCKGNSRYEEDMDEEDMGRVGGIVGTNDSEAVVQNCYNVGSLAADAETGATYMGGIAGKAEGIVANSYSAEESAEMNFGSMNGIEKGCKAWPENEMQTDAFLDQLNANRGDNEQWLEWEIRTGEGINYPLPVKRVNLGDCEISPASTEQVYDGTAKEPPINITYDGKTLTNGKDYRLVYRNNINVGTASVEVEGLGRYMDSVACTFEIVCADLAQCTVTLSENSFEYDGEAKQPKVTVAGKNNLTEGRDYTISWQTNVKPGKGKAILTGKGNYTGTVTREFTIQKASQILSYTKSYKKTWGDKAFSLNVKSTKGDGKLSFTSSDHAVAVVNGEGKVTLKGTGKTVVTVTAAATEGYLSKSVKITVTVAPKKQDIHVKKLAKQKIKVSWKKDTKATGYQIQYGTDSKFKKGVKEKWMKKNKTNTVTIGKLKKGKKYYVRVRAYKNIKGSSSVVYGSWSVKKGSGKIS